ncbi:Uncharacterised protein [Bordetella trematum]|uniref:Lipoprotein n=1 Tax=Bordetella trematum TaxID=123899 RepID=A0A157SJR3_9BORD|nr:hypothetical protein [Bordetella trematum]NNH20559.1 hypothetical protein [Bordetella trematum]QIM71889.1 hypothetical protein EYB34_11220 [Bordetella trematum]SAI19740.1 Uncharacterised protein [Bordetella trematum]SAI23519.1 Uncharacterised protein [Bordetella trematum]SAI70698.1 Uncharacterised protein [Bordetella trematum]
MSAKTLLRCTAVLFATVVMAGCSTKAADVVSSWFSSPPKNDCVSNRKACLYEGAYEPGERQYAEDEARRLNQAELARLRRASIR